jgi:peptidyl-prolyl cis-trans isomerase B (cyclophilin B)
MQTQDIQIILQDGRTMTAELYPELAPVSVANFVKLINEKYFDGLIFHRVIPNFMIQGGGMLPDMKEKGGAASIKGEFSINGWTGNVKLSHQPGVLSMARTNVPDSASSQFFIVTGDAKFLDGQYAAFGKLKDEKSFEVAKAIQSVATHSVGFHDDVPIENIIINTIKLV